MKIEEKIEAVQSIADVDPRFRALRPDVRNTITVAERECRKATADFIRALPPELADQMQVYIFEFPSKFMQAMFPFFHGLSTMTDSAESMAQVLRRAGLVD